MTINHKEQIEDENTSAFDVLKTTAHNNKKRQVRAHTKENFGIIILLTYIDSIQTVNIYKGKNESEFFVLFATCSLTFNKIIYSVC